MLQSLSHAFKGLTTEEQIKCTSELNSSTRQLCPKKTYDSRNALTRRKSKMDNSSQGS